MKFSEYLAEKKFDIKEFIGACKNMIKEYEKSDNKEGVKFLTGIVDFYEKEGSLSPAQVSGASKFLNPGK
jgi:hypothetical protein